MDVTTGRTLNHDLRINYQKCGAGYPVLLIHGWPETSYAWRKAMPLMASDHTLIAPDLPGCGHSSKPQGSYDKRTIAAHLVDMMNRLGHDRYFVVGHDMGSQVAYSLAAHHRYKVAGLVFMESGLAGAGLEDEMNVATGGSWHFGCNMASDLPETLVRGKETEFVSLLFYRDRIGVVSEDSVTDADVEVYAAALRRPGPLCGSFAYYRSLLEDIEHNREQIRRPLEMPVLAVSGERGYKDGATKVMRRVASTVESVIIADAGHVHLLAAVTRGLSEAERAQDAGQLGRVFSACRDFDAVEARLGDRGQLVG